MRIWIPLALVLLAAAPAAAQLGAPPQGAFGFFRCLCGTTVGAPLPNQFSFAPPPARQWNGSVYAVSDREAISKAQNACTAERRGSLFDCLDCRCSR